MDPRQLYASLKGRLSNVPDIGHYFGTWYMITSPIQFDLYNYIIDISASRIFTRPNETTGTLTRRASYFTSRCGTRYSIDEIIHLYGDTKHAIHCNSVDGNMFIICPRPNMPSQDIADAAYALFICAPNPLRAVINTDRQVHWVWFRRSPTYRLSEEILLRAASWIELNPGFTFHLWTGIHDETEFSDFIADISGEVMSRYVPHIQVHYHDEFLHTLEGWLDHNQTPEVCSLFRRMWSSTERQDIVMKTDYSRNIILAVKGGIYADFNDLICLAPCEAVLRRHAGHCIGVCDANNQHTASNYFMYAGHDSAEWQQHTRDCTATLPQVYAFIHSNDTLRKARDTLHALCDMRLETDDIIFLRMIVYAIAASTACPLPLKEKCAFFLRVRNARKHRGRFTELPTLCNQHKEDILHILSTDFDAQWRLTTTDTHLRTIMIHTNLPIFCREKGKPTHLLPFGYLLRYSCLLSYVGHLGDGTSYGLPATRNLSIRWLLGL